MSAAASSIMEAAGFTGRGSVAGVSGDALMQETSSSPDAFQAKWKGEKKGKALVAVVSLKGQTWSLTCGEVMEGGDAQTG